MIRTGDMTGVVLNGVVIERLMPGDRNNRSKLHIEYNIDPLNANYRRIYNAVLALDGPGFYDGEERLLRPTGRVIAGSDTAVKDTTPRGSLDGDHVIVQFIGGRYTQPVITGVLPHPKAGWRRTNADGLKSGQTYTKRRWAGSSLIYDQHGNIALDMADSDEPLDPKLATEKEITLTIGGERIATIQKGEITFYTDAGAVSLKNDLVNFFGGTNGVARENDATTCDMTTDPNFGPAGWFAVAHTLLQTLALTAGVVLPPPPTSVTGKITEGSAKVKAG